MIDAEAIRRAFEEIHRRSFLLDPASNRRLAVEVIDAGIALDTPTFVLIAPWTLNGLAFPPDGQLADWLEISGRRVRAVAIEVPGLGGHCVVNLVPDVSRLPSQERARRVAEAMAEPFRAAVLRIREGAAAPDPSRRRLLRRPLDAFRSG